MIGPIMFLLAFSAVSASLNESCSFNGYQLLRAVPHTEEQLTFLKDIQGVRGNSAARIADPRGYTKYMSSWLSASVVDVPSLMWGKRGSVNVLRRMLISKGMTATVIVENGNNLLDQSALAEFNPPPQFLPGMRVAEFDLEQYHRLHEIELLMKALKDEHPDSVELLTIGQSFEGRDITVVKVSTKEGRKRPKKGFWLEFGIHSREWISHATGLHFLVHLLTSNSPRAIQLRNNVDWYMVLVSNPDGYAYTWDHDRFWRKTRSIAPECVDVCQANRSISEEEFRACDGCCRGADPNRNWDVSWGGELLGLSQASRVMYQAYGTNMDWVRNATKIDFAFGVELRGDRDRTMALPAFCLPAKEIIPQAKEFWAGVEVLYDQIVVNNLTRPAPSLFVVRSATSPLFVSLLCFAFALLLCF
uniref:Peptidase M14 carboxypeptidase A domain-containing protein n=1 Tax=Plectus sambesii TaxID=2011161 RepID=A0A914XFR8_9BILA